MIGYLEGHLIDSTPEKLLLEVGGVGYEIHIPLSTYSAVERVGEGAKVSLFVHTHVRDDAIELFGFAKPRDKALFGKLIAVSGIGPRLARVILSGMSSDDLLAAITGGDAVRLATIPGVGKKTAERMVVELRDRLAELASEVEITAATTVNQDLVQALIGLGYKPAQAERAVTDAHREEPDAAFDELLRASLGRLSRA